MILTDTVDNVSFLLDGKYWNSFAGEIKTIVKEKWVKFPK